jgi:hypothetical protein
VQAPLISAPPRRRDLLRDCEEEDDMNKTLKRAGWLAGGSAGAFAAGWALYAATTWLRYGRPHELAERRDELLDRFMPKYDVLERHEIPVDAAAAVTFAAAREMDIYDSPLVRAIFRGRELLMFKRTQRRVPKSLLSETLSLGWSVLAEGPDREVVVGALARPWQGDPEFKALPPEEFAAFDEPGYAKIVWTLSAEPRSDSSSVFRTETRVVTTDPRSRALFRRYWSIFSPGILLIRSATLPLVKRDAERRAQAHLTGSVK